MKIVLRGGPAHGKVVNYHEGKSIVWQAFAYDAHYVVESVNGVPKYAQYVPAPRRGPIHK